jgi:hypothetical protein
MFSTLSSVFGSLSGLPSNSGSYDSLSIEDYRSMIRDVNIVQLFTACIKSGSQIAYTFQREKPMSRTEFCSCRLCNERVNKLTCQIAKTPIFSVNPSSMTQSHREIACVFQNTQGGKITGVNIHTGDDLFDDKLESGRYPLTGEKFPHIVIGISSETRTTASKTDVELITSLFVVILTMDCFQV